MKFVMKHFPFLFILVFLFSCNKKFEDNGFKDYYSKATFFEKDNKVDSAFYYFNQAKSSCNSDQATRMVFIVLKIAQLQERLGDFSGSEATATEAFDYFPQCDSISYIYAIYNSLGISYEQQKNYNRSIEYYNKALELIKSPLDKIIIKNNIAVISLEEKKYKEAIQKFSRLLKESILNTNKKYYAKIIDNLGYAYFNYGNKDLAYKYLIESLKIRDSIGDDYEKTPSLMHLARFYQDFDDDLTVSYAKKAYESAVNVNNPDDKLEALDILIQNSSKIDDLKKYYKQFYSLKDSIDFVRQTAKNQFANIKYESRLAIEESENQKKQKIIYLLLFVVSVLIALFIIYIIRKKNKEREKRIGYETETRISKKLHDELANDVFNTMTFIETQDLQNATNKENVLQGLDAIYDKARNISKQTSEVKTGKEFGVVLNQLLMSYNSKQVTVIVKGSALVDWEKIKEDKQVAIHRTLSELLVNMKKYSQANLVLVTFETLEKTIRIQYKDDGIGFEKEKISKNGLLNVENRIHEINGSITFDTETNKGLKINIEFPK